VFGNRVLRKMFGFKEEEENERQKKIHNEYFHDLYSSLNIIGVIKSRRMRWAGCVASMQRNV
jgi:hypothetical protein